MLSMGCHVSSRLTEVQCGVLFVLLSHSLHLMTLWVGGAVAGFTKCRMQFLDFKRLSARTSRAISGFPLFLVWPLLP